MKALKFLMIFISLLLMQTQTIAANADSALGSWVTIDDKTGQQKSIVRLYKKGEQLFGKVEKLLAGATTKTCTECKGENKNKAITGMTIIKNMKFDGEQWSGGTILDPKSGKTYSCKLWTEGNKLKVRGYISVFYRTQTWSRAK